MKINRPEILIHHALSLYATTKSKVECIFCFHTVWSHYQFSVAFYMKPIADTHSPNAYCVRSYFVWKDSTKMKMNRFRCCFFLYFFFFFFYSPHSQSKAYIDCVFLCIVHVMYKRDWSNRSHINHLCSHSDSKTLIKTEKGMYSLHSNDLIRLLHTKRTMRHSFHWLDVDNKQLKTNLKKQNRKRSTEWAFRISNVQVAGQNQKVIFVFAIRCVWVWVLSAQAGIEFRMFYLTTPYWLTEHWMRTSYIYMHFEFYSQLHSLVVGLCVFVFLFFFFTMCLGVYVAMGFHLLLWFQVSNAIKL